METNIIESKKTLLLPIDGLDYVGPLPDEVQQVTVFSAGVVTGAKNPDGVEALIRYLYAPAVADAIIESGLQPVGSQ